MCDYCDCRSTPEIGELSAEHDVITGLLRMLGAAARVADTPPGAAVEAIRTLLPTHADREERGVFAGLRAAGVPAGYVEQFEAEHDRIDALLAELDRPGWREASAQLVVLLSDHILREESDVYPAAHQLIADDQWDLMRSAHV